METSGAGTSFTAILVNAALGTQERNCAILHICQRREMTSKGFTLIFQSSKPHILPHMFPVHCLCA
jgi:hypothetical protein